MTIKSYLWGMGLASVLASISFIAILLFVSPEGAGSGGGVLILLFLSLFLALCGIFGLLGYHLRRRRAGSEMAINLLTISFREGTLLGLLLVGFLIMKVYLVFYWWTALIFLILMVAIEMAFLYQEKE
ncbi:MAG: hypothetical protein A3B04_00630 [Candidatus Portnoybacteria bacterium RIFCSPLOWO2_02_FULL_39_11]|uniref:Major facilitator superfamily (MFS) profile domain-containing protein n=1 Tax=Candidatus Portnoybacteria bacterium RIFCSPLOWO2_02_FULL_39_11 TaxID=1802001 RepID=A0A1G2FRG7_9BACT|nr:MAG: hypothetical protein A3B04_00630 [Candidatus Portnoybacteria bacterium RIFCSPLOWO2_02_FULL_39_11]